MRTRKSVVLFGFLLIAWILLGACKKSDVKLINKDEIDEIRVVVDNDNFKGGQEKTSTVTDLQEQEFILDDLNVLFTGKEPKAYDTNKIQAGSHYTIEMYKDNELVQKYAIYENTVTVGKNPGSEKKYEIKKEDNDKLNNLKNHLEKISQ